MTMLGMLLLAATFTRTLDRVTTVEPVMAQSVYDSNATQLIFETPLEVDYLARPYRLIPGACDLPEISPDGLTYVFRLRSEAVTADDMVRSLRHLGDPNLATPNGWMMKQVKAVDALDARTVRVTMKSRCHYFPWLMAMSPASIVRPDGSGTGPYRLTSWVKNHEMVFDRNPDYRRGIWQWGERSFDQIRYLVVDDASTQWLMFMKGEVDMLGRVSRDNLDAVVGADGKLSEELVRRGIRLYTNPKLDLFYLGMNLTDPVLGPNRKLRQALNAAFDFPAWERFYSGRILATGGPVPPGVDGRLETPFQYSFDLEKAKRLMAEAGYPNGIDAKTGRRLELTLAVGKATQDSREACELMAAFYDRIGIRLVLKYYTWNAFMQAVNEGRVQLFRLGWVADYPDAQNFLQLFLAANSRPGPNHCNYSNPEFERAYASAMEATDVETRNAQWRRCQEILREDCPWVYMHVEKENVLTHPRVGNVVPGDFPYGHEKYLTNEDTVH